MLTHGGRNIGNSRRGHKFGFLLPPEPAAVDFAVALSADIRRDTLFAPFHWGGRKAANLLTNPALDPKSRMPEFKVCAVRAQKTSTQIEG